MADGRRMRDGADREVQERDWLAWTHRLPDGTQPAVVVSHLRGEIEVLPVAGGVLAAEPVRCFVRRALGSVVAGDHVLIEDDPALPGNGVIVELLPRASLLRRRVRDGVRPVCANLDLLLITIAPEPRPHVDLVDRYLLGAAADAMDAMIVLNKTDLPARTDAEVAEVADLYTALGVDLIEVSAGTGAGLPTLRARIGGRAAALVGQSGVGKSSLINALLPAAGAETGRLSGKRNRRSSRGTHTTTTTRLYPLGDGVIYDSPGIREFQPEVGDLAALDTAFPEIAAPAARCQFRDCAHDGEPGCEVAPALAKGAIHPLRLRSWRALRGEILAAARPA